VTKVPSGVVSCPVAWLQTIDTDDSTTLPVPAGALRFTAEPGIVVDTVSSFPNTIVQAGPLVHRQVYVPEPSGLLLDAELAFVRGPGPSLLTA